MNDLVVLDKKLFTEKEIEKNIFEYAQILNKKYANETLILIGILNGCIFFISSLMRYLKIDVQLDFVAVSSYQKNISQENVKFYKKLKIDVKNKNILLIEDIIDTGKTIQLVWNHFQTLNPKTLSVCSLIKIDKKYQDLSFEFDHILFLKTPVWIVGFGIDYDEKFRNLNDIYQIKWLKSKKLIKTK